jgi:hypothetical protein
MFSDYTPKALTDLFSYLFEEYFKQPAEHLPGAITDVQNEVGAIKDFIQFSQDHLDKNQPVSFQYLDRGLGMRLSNGRLLSFTPAQTEAPRMQDEAVHITNQNLNRAGAGTVPNFNMQLTGKLDK